MTNSSTTTTVLNHTSSASRKSPRAATLDFVRQFARTCITLPGMNPGHLHNGKLRPNPYNYSIHELIKGHTDYRMRP